MKYVVLIRHGESYTNRNGILSSELNRYRLTEEGIEQARFTGEQLNGLKFSGIITSPVLRAVETANIINQYLNLEIKTDERAIESDFGEYNGKRIVDIPDKSREELGMESFDSQQKRMIDLLNSFSGNYIVVSHSFPIKCTISHYLGLCEEESFGIDIRHASMSIINCETGKILSIGSLLLSRRIKEIFSD
jgi:probable phosphoglycerate mutase